MTITELTEILETAGLPFTYYSYPIGAAPELPYFVYYLPSMTPEAADDHVHAPVYTVNVELYTKEKDFETEAQIEQALSVFSYEKAETYIDDEEMYMVAYTFEEVITWRE